jgi:membrane fusion protein (multidrug efflux system)
MLVTLETVREQTLRATLNGPGVVIPAVAGDWTVYAAEMGHIASLPRGEGDAVEAGDVLVRFEYGNTTSEVSARELDVSAAERRIETARVELARVSSMYDRGYTSRNEFESATSAVTSAELELARARQQLDAAREMADRAVVRARFSGVVASLFRREGDLVNGTAMDPVLRVVDPSNLEVAMKVAAADLPRIQTGQPATIVSVLGAEPATVLSPPVGGDPNAATQDVRVAFVAPTALPMDTAVQVEVLVAERAGVAAVPSEALLEDVDGQWYVMIVGADGLARRRDVRTGLAALGRVEIVEGLAPGDQVVARNPAEVSDGTLVASDR